MASNIGLFIVLLFTIHGASYGAHIPAEQNFSRSSLQCLNTTVGGGCKEYYFGDTVGPWDWVSCRQYCQSLTDLLGYDMDLVAIETKKENDVLEEYLNQAYSGIGIGFMTGGFDPSGSKDYLWVSTGYVAQFYDWWPGEPNGGPEEDVFCIHHDTTNTAGWIDILQSAKQFPLCERVGVNLL